MTKYTKGQQLLLEDGCPEFLIITPEREVSRKKAREAAMPAAQQVVRTDYLAEARRLQREKNQRNYQLKKEKEQETEIRRKLRVQQIPVDRTGMLWDTRRCRWVPDPFYKPQEDDLTKLVITPYDANGLIIGRGKTSIKDDASAEEITAKVLHAVYRAGKKTVKVELTRNGEIIETRQISETDIATAAAASAAEGSTPDAEEESEVAAKKKTNGKSKSGVKKEPGVIATIVETMGRASGVTVEEMAGILAKKFPDRKVKSMTSTCKIQLSKNAKSKDKDEKRGLVYYR